jgi:hypothetical protein
VPRKIAKEWVATDKVLPLLDGLDEVKDDQRANCVDAINAYRQAHGFVPLVVASRTSDYEVLNQRLRLHGAIQVRSLTRDQVTGYLADLGSGGEPVREALREDASLWELLDSPLMLYVVCIVCAGNSEAQTMHSGSVNQRRDRFFASYVHQMPSRGTADPRYPKEKTISWLSWLAHQMSTHSQTIFYLERMQFDWLPERQRWVCRSLCRLVCGLVCGLFGGLVGLLVVEMGYLESFGFVGGLVGGLAVGLAVGLNLDDFDELKLISEIDLSYKSITINGFGIFLLLGLVSGLYFGFYNGLHFVTEGVRNVVRGVERHFSNSGSPFFITFVLLILSGGIVIGLYSGLHGLQVAFIDWLSKSVHERKLELPRFPNQGIYKSAWNALAGGLGAALGIGVGVVLQVGLVGALAIGLSFGLIVGLWGGGIACLGHVAIRLLLVRNCSIPWKYVRFLDYAADRILLRKVGGGYMFIHRMLLEWFAARYVVPGVKDASEGGPSRPKEI